MASILLYGLDRRIADDLKSVLIQLGQTVQTLTGAAAPDFGDACLVFTECAELHAIRSAYGSTPWFIHYIDEIEALLFKKYDRLTDLQLATIHLGMKLLGLTTEVLISDTYVEKLDGLSDLRIAFHPKKELPPEVPSVPSYQQVFADRHGFVPAQGAA